MLKKLLLLVFLLGILVGCGGSKKEEVVEEQVLNTFIGGEPTTLDPSRGNDVYSSSVLNQIMEGLTKVEVEPDGSEKIVAAGAKYWDVSEDGLTWTFNLRDNKWEDGKPVVASEYVYSIVRTLDPNSAAPLSFVLTPFVKGALEFNKGQGSKEDVGVYAKGDSTLIFELKAPCPYFLDLTYNRLMYPQREDLIEKYGDRYGSEVDTFIGNGAFKLSEWVHSNKIIIEKNPTYWDADKVKLSRVNMNIIMDDSARMNMLLNGSVDLASVTKPEWIQKFDEINKWDKMSKPAAGINYMFFNDKDSVFKNKNIRKAFSMVINRQDMADVIFNGLFEEAKGYVPPGIYINGEEYRKVAKDYIGMLKTDNGDAKALLVKGLGELGLSTDPKDLKVTYLNASTGNWARTYTEYIQQMFKKELGVEIKAEFTEWPVFQKRTDEYDYQFAGMSMNPAYNDPNDFLEGFKSVGGYIPIGWNNERFDTIIDTAATTLDPEKRLELLEEAERILVYDEAVIAPTVSRNSNVFIGKHVKNLMLPTFGGTLYKYTEIVK